ncbi:MAG: 50S ribosomal protein L11 methyltransferase [Bacteroidetes bacterium]|nr:50S ribosomal protein L11 methyltransferase [Bacteroidota bacterium]
MEYIEVRLHPLTPEMKEIITSLLAETNFESFAGGEDELLAYVQAGLFSSEEVERICNPFGLKFTESLIPEQNWNTEWEKNFEPVLIAGRCYIRAPFHSPRPDYPYEIIIEPKMSFGTAHHETTSMMIGMMMEMDFKGKKVLDMGSGTGILAILARKLGAASVDAIDNDSWAYSNALENMEKNRISGVTVKMGDVDAAGSGYDILLANINRNVLIGHLPEYSKCMERGELLMSGFYEEDLPMIRQAAESNGFTFNRQVTKNRWVAAQFKK